MDSHPCQMHFLQIIFAGPDIYTSLQHGQDALLSHAWHSHKVGWRGHLLMAIYSVTTVVTLVTRNQRDAWLRITTHHHTYNSTYKVLSSLRPQS